MKTHRLLSIITLALLAAAGPLQAADEPAHALHIQEFPALGLSLDIHYTMDVQMDVTVAVPFRKPESKSRNAKADLVGRVQTTKVSKSGEPLELTLWIKKMTRLDGRDMAKPGMIVDIIRTEGDATFKPRDNQMVSDEAKNALKSFFHGNRRGGGLDKSYGSASPRKIGEKWAVDPKIFATDPTIDEIIINERDVKGETTLKAAETRAGIPVLRLESTVSAENARYTAYAPIECNGEATVTTKIVVPAYGNGPAQQISIRVDVRMVAADPKARAAGEAKGFMAITLLNAPVEAEKTASASPKP